MKNENSNRIKAAFSGICPSDELVRATKEKMLAEMSAKNNRRNFLKLRGAMRVAAACLAVVLLSAAAVTTIGKRSIIEKGAFTAEGFSDATSNRALGTYFSGYSLPMPTAVSSESEFDAAFIKATSSKGEDVKQLKAEAEIVKKTVYASDSGSDGFCFITVRLRQIMLLRNSSYEYRSGDCITVYLSLTDINRGLIEAPEGTCFNLYLYAEKDGTAVTETGKKLGLKKIWELYSFINIIKE